MIKWHDLGKNPNDLPEKADTGGKASRIVMAVVDMDDCFDYRCFYYSYAFEKWFYAIDSSEFEFKVLKWAYIEYTEDAKPSPQHDLTELRDAILEAANEVHVVTKDNLKRVKEIDGTLTVGATIATYTAAYTNILLAIVKGFADYGKTD